MIGRWLKGTMIMSASVMAIISIALLSTLIFKGDILQAIFTITVAGLVVEKLVRFTEGMFNNADQ